MSGKSNSYCQGKESFERMNFLYQAGTLMSSTNPVLSCYYGQLCRAIAKKAVLRMEPAIKRTICKACGCIMVAGTSAHLRMNERNPKLCEIECDKCGTVRRFTINDNYVSWLDDERSVKEQLCIDSVRTRMENQTKQTTKKNGDRSMKTSGDDGSPKIVPVDEMSVTETKGAT